MLHAPPGHQGGAARFARLQFDARLCRTHARFARQLEHRPSAAFCAEPVHPDRTGHLLIAWGLLSTLED